MPQDSPEARRKYGGGGGDGGAGGGEGGEGGEDVAVSCEEVSPWEVEVAGSTMHVLPRLAPPLAAAAAEQLEAFAVLPAAAPFRSRGPPPEQTALPWGWPVATEVRATAAPPSDAVIAAADVVIAADAVVVASSPAAPPPPLTPPVGLELLLER